MSALATSAGKSARMGVNGTNVRHFTGVYTGDVANGDTVAITLPDYEAGPWTVIGFEMWTDSDHAAGARTRTYKTKANFTLNTFVEATGVVNTTLVSGGTLTNPRYSITLLATE